MSATHVCDGFHLPLCSSLWHYQSQLDDEQAGLDDRISLESQTPAILGCLAMMPNWKLNYPLSIAFHSGFLGLAGSEAFAFGWEGGLGPGIQMLGGLVGYSGNT